MSTLNIFKPQKEQTDGSAVPAGKQQPADFRRYVDPAGELSARELRYGIWFAKRRKIIHAVLVGGLITISAVLWGYSSWHWGAYAFVGYFEDRALHREAALFPDYLSFAQHFGPQTLSISEAQILPGGKERYDALAEAFNPNSYFFAEFDFSFVVDGVRTPLQHAFILPGERRWLGALGLAAGGGATSPIITVERISWKRISAHEISNPEQFQRERLNFSLKDFSFTPASAESAGAHIISFNLTNQSAFGYVEPKFYLGLYNDQNLIGVIPWQTERLESLETRAVDLRSFVPSLRVTRIELFPLINVYDPVVYAEPPK